MPDNQQNKPARSQADKERSRQQSRAVSGKEAARGVSGQPGRGQRSPTSPPAKGTKGAQAPPGGARRPPARGRPSRGPARARSPRRSPTALLTWGVIGLVVVVVVVFVAVHLSSSSTSGPAPSAQPLPATIAHQITNVPESVYNTVGISSPTVPVAAPHPISGQKLLVIDGKPGVFYMGGEFCPFCAAQRWVIATALARFGTFTGLETMQSSATDVDPKTQTITFAKATYTSPYIGAQLVEYYSNQPKTGGGYTILTPLTKAQEELVREYDTAKYTGGSSTSSGSIPFVDIGNKVLAAGASYRPTALQSLTRAQIAAGLSNPANSVTQAILSSANYLSASICSIDGAKPASVCTGKGVQDAAKTLGLKL